MWHSPRMVLLAMTFVRVQSMDLTQYVLPSTGSNNGGNTFPGVCLPFGMVKLGPDLFSGSDSYSGNSSNGNFTGFSMMHESGTGGAPKYGVVSQMPFLGNLTGSLSDSRSAPDVTSVGYYKASLRSNIAVELSATSRARFYRYTFPEGSIPHVMVDVSHVLPSYRGQGISQTYLGGRISTSSDHYEGYGEYNNGWNRAPAWRICFCGYFDSPFISQTFIGSNTNFLSDAFTSTSTERLGAVFRFNSTKFTSRVGISFISTSQACENVNSQIPAGTTLSFLTSNARNIWNEDVLSKVITTESDVNKLQLLYSSMYHMHMLPSNRTGENPLWSSPEPYYDDTFTLWDLFRCTFALFQIFQPTMYNESSNFNGTTQGGSNSDNILADACVKGVRGAVNWTAGYEAMVKNAEVTPENNNDTRDLSSSTKEGRGALPDWHEHGFITPKYGRSVSRAMEYSVNDFSLHQVAKALGRIKEAKKYLKRSRNWRNHWNPNATSLNFTGFMVPRTVDGFLEQDPLRCAGCYWGDHYYQALPWEYGFNAHHDIDTLIALCNGSTAFVERLEMTFKSGINTSNRSSAFNNTIFNPGNEPSFTTPYLYNYVGRQDLSVKQSRHVAKSYYSPTPGGLPGNSDAGAMESWLIWNMLGLYPMVGQPIFLIGSPWFANTTISLGSGKKVSITTTGGSESLYYVQSLAVNGRAWNQSLLTWNDTFADGGTMAFVLGTEPRNWTTGNPPPSPASEYEQNADPTVIINPETATMSLSSPEAQDRQHHRQILRNVVDGAIAFAMLMLGACAFGVEWFYYGRQRKQATLLQRSQRRGAAGGKVDSGVNTELKASERSSGVSGGEYGNLKIAEKEQGKI